MAKQKKPTLKNVALWQASMTTHRFHNAGLRMLFHPRDINITYEKTTAPGLLKE